MADLPAKPLSPSLRALRVTWACLIVTALVFSILMAVWGDLRQGLMLKVIDDRYNKSFTLQVPQGAKVWMGTQYLGAAEPHPLSDEEPEDSDLKVEGISVLLPRVYFYEPQLMEQSAAYEPTDATADLLAKLVPEASPVWTERDTFGESGFVKALLKHDDGRVDFVNLARGDWPTRHGGQERRAFVLRVIDGDNHVFGLKDLKIWSDQISADEGGFWPQRQEFDGFPAPLKGQSKTAWHWFLQVEPDAPWLKQHAPGEINVEWFKLPEDS